MSDKASFLKFLLTEDVYVIDEKTEKTSTDSETTTETIANSPSVEGNQLLNKAPKPTSEFLILFDNSNEETMKASESEFLQKILSAVKIDLNAVDLINVNIVEPELSLYKKVISFTSQYPLEVTDKYKLVSNDQMILLADGLTTIASSVDLKKKLWVELQGMFR